MNTLELNALLSTLLADSSNNFYSQSERLQALNSACSYLNSELRILRQVIPITVTPLDNGNVPIPVDFVSLAYGTQWDNLKGAKTQLRQTTPQRLQFGLGTNWESEVGEPVNYVLEGSNIYLNPSPNSTGILYLSYITMPNKLLEDHDIPFFGDSRIQAYHDIIAFYAAWQLCLKDRDFEAAQMFMQYFQTRLIDLKENLRHTGDIVQPVWSDTYGVT